MNGRLQVYGDVKLGVALEDAGREASLARGSDGLAAELSGGWLDVGQGGVGANAVRGSAHGTFYFGAEEDGNPDWGANTARPI